MAEAKKSAKTKRRVKDPETFRQKVVKAAEDSGKPKRVRRIGNASTSVASKVWVPFGKFFGAIGRSKFFKPFKRPLRFIGRILLPSYIRTSWEQLRLVTWPSFRLSLRLTWAVLIFAVIFAAIVAAIDYGLDKLFREILLK